MASRYTPPRSAQDSEEKKREKQKEKERNIKPFSLHSGVIRYEEGPNVFTGYQGNVPDFPSIRKKSKQRST